MNATVTADVGPLVWRRVRAGQHEADAGRFGKFAAERMPNGRWDLVFGPGGPGRCPNYRTLRQAQRFAGRYVAHWIADDPRTLLEWGVAILYRRYEASASDLYQEAICRAGYPRWYTAAGIDWLAIEQQSFAAGPACLALQRIWDAAVNFPVARPTPLVVSLARDCLADPSLLGVLADAAQDAGNPTLEEAARSVAAAVESLRAGKGG